MLKVADNGVGLPENFDIKKLNSLGLDLVTNIVTHLNGELEISRN